MPEDYQIEDPPKKKIPTPQEVLGKTIPKPEDILGEKKNLGGTPSSFGVNPFDYGGQSTDKNKWVKPIPASIGEGVERDKKKDDSVLGGIYNMLVGTASRLVGGIAETTQVLGENLNPIKQPQFVPEGLMRQKTSEFIDKARTAKSSRENEQARSQFDITDGVQASDVKALLFQAPSTIADMVAGAFTYGTSFFFQSVADNAKELDESPAADKLNPDEKMVYLFLQGTVQAALEKYSIDKILKSTGLSSKVKQKIANEIADEFVKKGVKATAKDIEKAALKKVTTLAAKAKNVGVKAATSMGVEAATEAGQQMASDGIKLLANKVTDKKVFDEEDIKVNFIKNAINAGAQGGVFGGVLGGGASVLTNTNKAIRNELAKAQTPEDVQKIQQQIAEQVELGNITEEEAQAANITAQQYAEIAAKIPQEVDAEKKYAIIGGIEQRENLKKEIQKATEELSGIDPAFHSEKKPQIELLQAKLEQTNDYIEGLVAGKKPTYRKEGEEFIKTSPDGTETKITKEHYELAVAVREEEANKNKQATTQPTGEGEAATVKTKEEALDVFEPEKYVDDYIAIDFNEEKNAIPDINKQIEGVKNLQYPLTVYRGINTKRTPERGYDGGHWSTDKKVAESFGDKVEERIIGSQNEIDLEQTIRSRVMNPAEKEIYIEPKEQSLPTQSKATVKEGEGAGDLAGNEKAVTLGTDEGKAQNIPTKEAEGAKDSTRSSGEEKPEKLNERLTRVVSESEITDPYDTVLKHFATGGKIHTSVIESLFGGKDKRIRQQTTTEGEKRARISLLDKKGQTIDELAHSLWEQDPTGKYTTEDYKDAIERVLTNYNSKSAMAKDLVERYDLEAGYEKYLAQKHGQEAIDIVEKMTEDEINHILRLDADETSKQELEKYLDEKTTTQEPTKANEPIPTETESQPEKGTSETPPPAEPPKTSGGIFVERPGTELSHRGLQNVANEFSFPDVEVRERKSDIELRQEARETVDGWAEKGQYASKVEGLVKKAEEGEILTDKERVILEGHLANLSAEARKTREEFGVTSKEYSEKLAELKRLKDAGEKTRSEAGAALRIPTFNSSPKTIEDALILEQDNVGVTELTDKQKETVVREFEEIEKVKQAFEEYRAKKEAELAERDAALKIQEEKKKTTRTKKTDAQFSEERKQIIADIKEKLKKARGETTATIIPYANELIAISPDVAKLVKSLVEQGVTKLGDVVDKIHEILSEDIEGITKKDVNDLIAGNYAEKKQTRNEKAKTVFELKREAQLLNEYEKLESGVEPKKEKDKIKRNQRLKELRDKIDSHNLTKLAESKSRIKSQIEKLEDQIKKGDYSKEEKKQPVKLDKEGNELRDKLMKLQQQRDARMLLQKRLNEPKREKALRYVAEVFNIPRTLMTIADFSGLLRQNLFFSVGHPGITSKALPGMFKTFTSQKVYDRWFADLKETPRYHTIQKSRLAIADSLSHDLSKREEDFMSTLAEKIPVIGRDLSIGKGKIPGLNIVKGSERSYTYLLNKVRVDMFNYFADMMEARGMTTENSPKEFKAMAEYINNATGRSDFGETLNRVAPILNATFFSPRLIASRINMLTYWAQPRFWKTLPKEARLDYFRNWSSLLAVGGTILALASLAGADVEDDPRSSDFGKIKSGDTRWDIWGGAQPYVRTLAQIVTGQRKSTNTGKIYDLDGDDIFGKTRADVVAGFFRNKLAPVPGAAVDVFSGRTGIGDKLIYQWGGAGDKEISIDQYVKERLLPMTITGTQEAIRHDGLKTLFTVGVPTIFGVGTQTYSTPKKAYELSEEEKKAPVLKTFIDKGVEIQKPDPKRVETKEINGKAVEHLSDYDEKTQKDYVDKWWKYYQQELEKLKNGTIKVYVDKNGTATAPTTADGRKGKTQKSFNTLTPDQINNVLSKSIKGDVTEKVKAEVLKDKKPK